MEGALAEGGINPWTNQMNRRVYSRRDRGERRGMNKLRRDMEKNERHGLTQRLRAHREKSSMMLHTWTPSCGSDFREVGVI
jgi:hypothetical protein